MEDTIKTIDDLEHTAYAVSPGWLIDALGVDPVTGLSDAEIRRRRTEYGPNTIGTARKVTWWQILLNQFRGAVVWLLIAAAALSLWLGDLPEAVAIGVVLVINSAIGFATESRAAKSMEALRKLTHTTARVRRQGREFPIDAEDLVPGDIVLLDAGDVVPADMRLVTATDLHADESTLTGESLPVDKSTEAIVGAVPLADRSNMAFRGTSITRGNAVGITTATGSRTQLGQISELVASAKSESTPLERRLDQLGRHLAVAALALSAMIALAGFASGRPLIDMLETTIALAVAAVPEGLPIVATLALARGMWRMAARNVLINRLSAVETLGSANVLLTDKTGTLTENRMTVAEIVFADGAVEPGQPADPSQRALLEAALRTMALCNDAVLDESPQGGSGDPMEIALLLAARDLGGDPVRLVEESPRLEAVAFDPDVKMMASVNRVGRESIAYVKGAPESVLAAATKVATADGIVGMTPDRARHLEKLADAEAAKGLRMLGLAQRHLPADMGAIYNDLTFIGLVGLRDPARSDVPAAIAECHEAGVRVIMVTGDHKVTASKIAQEIGLVPGRDARVAGNADILPALDDEGAAQSLLDIDVFARVPPHEKLKLVALHQEGGAVVAMTGDGVNDAPALRKADIGIAMGRRGTQVAAEASDVILRDDSFGSIVEAMRQGRIIYGNIRAFIRYLSTCNLSEILLIALATFLGLPMPLAPLQILFLNLITDIFPAIALGFGEGPKDVMRVPPRRPGEPLVTRRIWTGIVGEGLLISGCVLALFVHELDRVGTQAASSSALLSLCFAQLFFVFAIFRRGESFLFNQITRNPFVWLAVALSSAIMLSGVYVPLLADVLGVVSPDRTGWYLILAASAAPALVATLRRILIRL